MKNFIDITGAILITGFIIWVIAKVEIILKGRFHPKNSNGIVKKERVVFFRRHKRAFLIGLHGKNKPIHIGTFLAIVKQSKLPKEKFA